jgi:uncharacterized surface protein with fasciclin (FAS1) repeats
MKRQLLRFTGTCALAVACVMTPLAATTARASENCATIVETALAVNAETGEFSTLIAAVVRAGLVDTLNGHRQFTVFAPTDAAFAKLGLNAGNIDTVPLDALRNILLYHVAPGERFAEDVVTATKVRMLNMQFAPIGTGPTIGGAGFVAVDVDVCNGVIHVIDSVLIPSSH